MSEYAHVEKPFLAQLQAMGWIAVDQGGAIPSDPTRSLRSSFRGYTLPQVFRDSVRALNALPDGRAWLTDAQLDGLHSDLFRQPNKSLLEANEAVQALLFKAQTDRNALTGEQSPVVRLIDFDNPERNIFHAINQFRVDTPGCVRQFIIPDMVLFVNGLPLVVIEGKIGDANTANPMHEAFVQLQRYRGARKDTIEAGLREGEPRLFYTNLLLVRSCGEACDYGTITSGDEHFYRWRSIWPERYETYAPPLGVARQQEALIQGLLNPHALLDVLRTCSVFKDTEGGKRIKVVARYQQHRAARRIVERLRTGKSAEERSGVVWHTQGSGKSLTMVFLARMLRTSSDLADFKIVMVNDRIDLEEQLTGTAKLIGGRVNVIDSAANLRSQLGTDASDLNMVMVHKFLERDTALPPGVAEAMGTFAPPPRADTFGIVNPSERILLLIDEAHRTQGSDLGDNLFEAFPKATRIAFTGTPLITERHAGKRTVKRFGEYIDSYKIMDAVEDGATLQILYEGRTAETALRDKAGFDEKFEDLFRDRSEEELIAIKKKYGATGDLLEAENRIGAIARDLVNHYIDNILPNGFKAQVVCHSKIAAIRYQRAIRAALAERLERERKAPTPNAQRIAQIAFLKAVVVVSGDQTNEAAEITVARKEAREWNAVENFCKPFNFEDYDESLSSIAFLIVCDMLLTGFDAPIEQVMYIDKRLKEHNLLQAIARVNRVTSNKRRGFIVDYIGLANHLSSALAIYANEDPNDLLAGLRDVDSEIPILEERYTRLLQLFQSLGIGEIERFVTGATASPTEDIAIIGKAVTALEPIKQRADFEVFLKKFLQSLDLVLPGSAALPYRVPAKRFGYLMRMAKERYKDTSINIAGVGAKVRDLIDEHLVELGINPKIPPTELLDPDFIAGVSAHSHGDGHAKASEMEHAIRKHCTVKFDEDPAFYTRMSEKVEALIQRHGEDWQALADDYQALRAELLAGREPEQGVRAREAAVVRENIMHAIGAVAPEKLVSDLPVISDRLVTLIAQRIRIVDFWRKPDEQRQLRADLANEFLLSGHSELATERQRLAVELVKLAEKRQSELAKL